MALPTAECITNKYLYKQDEVIDNRLDDKIISRDESSITVDNRLNERIIDRSVHLDARKYNSPNSLNA